MCTKEIDYIWQNANITDEVAWRFASVSTTYWELTKKYEAMQEAHKNEKEKKTPIGNVQCRTRKMLCGH